MVRGIVCALALALAACPAHRAPDPIRIVETQKVEVPVGIQRAPPPELLAPYRAALPHFVAPGDPAATSALTADGERDLRALVSDLNARIKAWEDWAKQEDGSI